MSGVRCLVAVLLLAGTTGCAKPARTNSNFERARYNAYISTLQHQALVLAWYNAALQQSFQRQRAELARVGDARGYIAKLQELSQLNEELVRRLDTAEKALQAALASEQVEDSERVSFAHELEDIRRKRAETVQQKERMVELVTELQRLLDAGVLRVTHEAGRPRLILPPELDAGNPWRDDRKALSPGNAPRPAAPYIFR